MKKKHKVFNSNFDTGHLKIPRLTNLQEKELFAELFEQIMFFDRIYLKVGPCNFALVLLIKNLGLDLVERLIGIGYIKFILYTPVILTSNGRQREDGTIDDSTIYGQEPISSGTLQIDNNFLEETIDYALSLFEIPSKRKKLFKKRIYKSYTVPDGKYFSKNSTKLVLDAYENNELQALDLPNDTLPKQMNLKQRQKLQQLGHNVLETTILSTYNLKGFNSPNNFNLLKSNYENLGNALEVTSNGAKIFELENIPNIKKLFLEENLNFENVIKLRNNSNAKFFRNWLNTKSENINSLEITEEYLNELKGKNNIFNSTQEKLMRTLANVSIGTGLSAIVGNPIPSLSIALFTTLILENLIKGKSPSAFVDTVKNKVRNK